jgi:hypothetical protein
MSDDAASERLRIAEEAARMAREEAERATAEAARITAEALTGEAKQEGLRQLGVIYGALIVIGVYIVQPFLTAPTLDVPARISVIAFSVAIPLLAALVLVNRQETFRGRRATSVAVVAAQSVAQVAAVVGTVAGFWHITWVAGVSFLVAGIAAIGVHSAGWWRVENDREPTS